MKISRYNFCVPNENGTSIIYNTLRNTYTRINTKKYNSIIKNIDEKHISDELVYDIRVLLENGVLLKDDQDELLFLKNQYFEKCYNSSSYNFTIIPTLDCNLKCDYCFIDQKSIYMSDFIIQKVIQYIVSIINNKHQYLKHFNLKWFGGEPLLHPKAIEKISCSVIKTCDSYDIKYHSMVYTNLTVINSEIINALKKSRVTHINTTLDGYAKDNDTRRRSKDGKDYFETIINNIKLLKRSHFNINIQVNIDKRNINQIKELVLFLKNERIVDGRSVTIGFNLVNDNSNIYNKEILYSYNNKSVLDKIDSFYKELEINIPHYMPTQCLSCLALANNTAIVDPNGCLYKCYKDSKTNLSYGNIIDNESISEAKYLNQIYDPFKNYKCINCNVFPICYGGCPNFGNDENICSLKHILSYKIQRAFGEYND